MFTGIVHHCGSILAITEKENSISLNIETQFDHLKLGESIAVDGACFTVTNYEPGFFSIDVSSETLSVTTLGEKKVADMVHLERSMRTDD